MPSTIVHLAFAGLIASALLGTCFDRRSLLVVLGATAFIDLDAFVALVSTVGHRASLHNLMIPLFGAGLLWVDVSVREDSRLLDRWGQWGLRVAWVTLLCYAVAGVLLDLTDGVVNLFWPVHDQFYVLEGKIELSDQRGIVQTFIETSDDGGGSIPAPESVGTTEEVDLSTGVNPGEAEDGGDAERIFPVIGATWELLVFLTGTAVTAARFYVGDLATEE
jgi:inner membrane protein